MNGKIHTLIIVAAFSLGTANAENCLSFFAISSATETQDSDNDGTVNLLDRCNGALDGAFEIDKNSGCPTKFNPTTGLTFDQDDPKHQLWYQHFWFGGCEGLSFWRDRCVSGYPWDTLVNGIFEQTQDELLRAQLWSAGRYIGYEWARDNEIRRISSNDVKTWGRRVRKLLNDKSAATDIFAGIESICAEAEAKIDN